MTRKSLLLLLASLAIGPGPVVHAEPVYERVRSADVQFQPLNPARGDAGPQAGVLWGNIHRDMPTGALIRFTAGFSSPPHIHNITYRAVVISGAAHNDDPAAAELWMGPGSFWTQPAGEVHITAAADGPETVAFLEILEGPYLVRPPAQAFDAGERPINVADGNIVWLDAADVTHIQTAPESSGAADSAKMAFLWGGTVQGAANGTFLRLPPGGAGELGGNEAWLRAVVISGQVRHRVAGESNASDLSPGSYFGATGALSHAVTCAADQDCVLYISTRGRYTFEQR